MLKLAKNSLTAMMLSAVAITPVATISFVAMSDAAYAKGKKDKSSKSDRGSKSKRDKAVKAKKAKKQKQAKVKKQKGAKGAKPVKYSKDGSLHPSQLGNMNGALNANENAILAHIRNGNTNGPVGLMAALAVADADTADSRELLGSPLADDYSELNQALEDNGFETYQDYLDSLEDPNAERITAIDDAVDRIGTTDLENALGSYESYEDYELAAYGDGTDENPGDASLIDLNIEAAQTNLGQYDEGTDQAFRDAEVDAETYERAMDDALNYWNKGDADSEEADALRQLLEARIDSYENVEATLEEQRIDEEEVDVTDDETCVGGDTACDGEETALLED